MKAFLLAAGLGARLRPLTNSVPKCMVPIDGKPMLHYWFSLLQKHHITDVLINLHHLPEKVIEYVKSLGVEVRGVNFELCYSNPKVKNGDKFCNCRFSEFRDAKLLSPSAPARCLRYGAISIALSYEEELLGSAGTVRENADWVKSEREFFIAYADNLTNANLTKLLQFHQEKKPILTMGLFRADYPEGCGIASLDENGLIVDFVEKPKKPKSNLANAGIYIATPELIHYIFESKVSDLGHDVLPKLIGKMYGCEIDGYLRDVGTHENYRKAQEEWREVVVMARNGKP